MLRPLNIEKKGDTQVSPLSIGLWVSVCLRYQNEGQAGAKILDFLDHFLEELRQLFNQRLDFQSFDRSQLGCVLLGTTARATAPS